MRRLVVVFAILLSRFFPLHAQGWTPPYKEVVYQLNELKITEKDFLNALDSLVFAKSCPDIENRIYQYFSMQIEESDLGFCIRMEVYKIPLANVYALGYFVYKDYTFFVYGCNPCKMFLKTRKSKIFKYKEGTIPFVEDFPLWIIKMQDGNFTLEYFECW